MRSIYRWWIKMLWIGLIITKRGFFLSYPFSYLSSLSVWVHKSFFYIIIFSFLFRFVSVAAAACGFCCATFERVEMRKQVFLQFYYLKLWVFWHSKYSKKSKYRKKWKQKKNLETFYKFVGFDVQKLDLNYLNIVCDGWKIQIETMKIKNPNWNYAVM